MRTKFSMLAMRRLFVILLIGVSTACSDQFASTDALAPVSMESRMSADGTVTTFTAVGPSNGNECTVTRITTNTTWTPAGNPYYLYGDVRVTNNATLTIQAGVVVRGDKASKGMLTIERGAKIVANGTPTSPIVFTSGQQVGSRKPKDWGGIHILGRAFNNQGTNVNAEGYPTCVTAPQYGGTNAADNSGVLRYVRIEFAGMPSSHIPESEKNGLTLYSVGSATTIDHVQVSFSGDDSFEWFGGTTGAKYLISYKCQDDDFDTDFGFRGKVQFGIAYRDPSMADDSGASGIESDTDADGLNANPTSAVFSNFTLVGPYDPGCIRTVKNDPPPGVRFMHGLHLRRNSRLKVYNTIITGWTYAQVYVDPVTAVMTGGLGDIELTHITSVKPFNQPTSLCFEEPEAPHNVWTREATNLCNNATLCASVPFATGGMLAQSGLSAQAWQLSNPSVRPWGASVPVMINGRNAALIDPWFTTNVTSTQSPSTYYRGARRFMDDNGWDFGGAWVNYDPENTPYPN